MNTPERIMVAKCHPFKEPDDLYVCHPRLQHPAAVEFTRADLCADPALLAEAVEVLRKLRHSVCGETGFAACVRLDSGKAYPWPALDDADESARAFLSKLENRHDR